MNIAWPIDSIFGACEGVLGAWKHVALGLGVKCIIPRQSPILSGSITRCPFNTMININNKLPINERYVNSTSAFLILDRFRKSRICRSRRARREPTYQWISTGVKLSIAWRLTLNRDRNHQEG